MAFVLLLILQLGLVLLLLQLGLVLLLLHLGVTWYYVVHFLASTTSLTHTQSLVSGFDVSAVDANIQCLPLSVVEGI